MRFIWVVSAALECKNVYLTSIMSAYVIVDCVRGCPSDCVHMSKFACKRASEARLLVCWEWLGTSGGVSQCSACLGLMKD